MSRLKRATKTLRLSLLIVLMSPIWLVMIFTGFPPPLPPWLRTRPAQAQSQPLRQQDPAARRLASTGRRSEG